MTLRSTLAATIEHFLSFDAPMLRTAIDLMRFPGRVADQYIAGRRRAYASPLKYSLIAGTLVVAIVHLLPSGDSPLPHRLQRLGNSPFEQLMKEAIPLALKWHTEYLYLVYFLGLPILALFMRLLFWRSGRNTIEFYVLCLFVYGQVYLIQGVCMLLATAFDKTWSAHVFEVISSSSPFLYFSWATVGFLRRGFAWAIVGSLLAQIVFSFAVIALLIGVAAAYILANKSLAGG